MTAQPMTRPTNAERLAHIERRLDGIAAASTVIAKVLTDLLEVVEGTTKARLRDDALAGTVGHRDGSDAIARPSGRHLRLVKND